MPDVKLFGRKMRRVKSSAPSQKFRLGEARVYSSTGDNWIAWLGNGDDTRYHRSPHAAARALERKIRAAHARLGRLIDGKKGRGK